MKLVSDKHAETLKWRPLCAAGSGANAVRVQAEDRSTFLNEETEAGPSQAPAGQGNWEVKVQCWGAAFLQGAPGHCLLVIVSRMQESVLCIHIKQ